jgi:BirA family transcriptional regulator, biotin operon repressor / biotin---[acetyl-CoA-carboxylase] ligase
MIIGSNLLFFKNLPSTNSEAALLIKKENLPEGTVIYTNYQSAGRGYLENTWESEDGKNLLISIILLPSFIKASDQFYISMTVSLGICDFLARYIPACSIKWPNDIYIHNDKIAGILIESAIISGQIEYSIAGIGLNINQERFVSSAPNPVSLRQITGSEYDLKTCLIQLCTDIDRRYKKLMAGDTETIKNEYLSKLYRMREWAKFRDADGIFTGRIVSIGDYGCLQLELQNDKNREYAFKEIEFIQ